MAWGFIVFCSLLYWIWPSARERKWKRLAARALFSAIVVLGATKFFLWPDILVQSSCGPGLKGIVIPPHSTAKLFGLRLGNDMPFGVETLRNPTSTEFTWPPTTTPVSSKALPQFVTAYECAVSNHGPAVLKNVAINLTTTFAISDKRRTIRSHQVIIPILDPGASFNFYVANLSNSAATTEVRDRFYFREITGLLEHSAQLVKPILEDPTNYANIALWFPPTGLDFSGTTQAPKTPKSAKP